MLPVHAQTKIYLARDPADMRKSFRGLIALTDGVLQKDPLSGHLFVFLNRRRDMMKVLYWDLTGYCIWHKRLEVGRFQLPSASVDNLTGIELSPGQLTLILEGIDLGSVKQRLRYRRPASVRDGQLLSN